MLTSKQRATLRSLSNDFQAIMQVGKGGVTENLLKTVSDALEARELLRADGIDARVINIHTIKPIDREIIAKAAEETGAIVTAEEHNILGGLGAAVAEVVCETKPVPVLRVGIEDSFGRSGKVPALLEMYGLTPANIAAKAKAAIALK